MLVRSIHRLPIAVFFHLETDHKQLVSLLSSKKNLSPRIQRFRMRLMRYMYTIAHVPGKSLVSADALSRVPQERPLTEADVLSTDEVTAQANLVEVRYLQQRSAWPRSGRDNSKTACVDRLSATVRRVGPATFLAIGAEDFWQVQNDLTIQNGILKGIWLVIPTCMRATGKLHEDHQGVVRYRSRAQSSVWWLGPSCQLEELVRSFSECPPQSTSLDVSLPPSHYQRCNCINCR